MKQLVAAFAAAVGSLSVLPAPGGGGGDGAIDFAYDVLPWLQRGGCASAYCHGSASGQGGFKLSLFGGDPLADYGALATELGGRRVDVAAPDRSLVLQKALGKLDHGGGRRLPRDGEGHRALRAWIAAGAPWRTGPERALGALALRRDGDRLVAIVDLGGVASDVTARASFTTTDPRVVVAGDGGTLRVVGPGRAFVVARFANATATLPVVQPFAAPSVPPPAAHALDAAWGRHLAELGLQPAPPAAPQRLARRLWLDLAGRPPAPHELDAFLRAPDVERTVRAVAARGEFAEVWGEHLAAWCVGPAAQRELRRELGVAVARGVGLERSAGRVADGELPLVERAADPRDRAEYAARVLLGVRVGCARCHDHPDDRWQQHEHLAFSAAFAPRAPQGRGMAPGGLYDDATGERVAPRWLALPGSTARAGASLREFVLDAGHGQLARHFANRVFAAVIGRGLVEPVDDHRPGNPPLHRGMLAVLEHTFRRTGGDLVELLVLVTTSRLYALASGSEDDPRARWLALQPVRALSPAAFARAAAAVLGRDPRGTLPAAPLPRELALRNGPFVHDVLAGGGTTVDAAFELAATPVQRIHDLWVASLTRLPRRDEVDEFTACAAADLAAFRELAHAILLGREFGQRR